MPQLTAAADGSHLQGAMIALMPTEADAQRLALDHPDAEDAGQLHCTLAYLGEGAAFSEDERASLIDLLTEEIGYQQPGSIKGTIFGANHWNGSSDEPSWVWAVGDKRTEDRPADAPLLSTAREIAWYAIRNSELDTETLPEQHSPWVPHICAAYSSDPALLAQLEERLGEITFDRIRVAFAGDHTDIPLDGAMTAAAGSLRRKPTDLEARSRADFAAMDAAWREAVEGAVDAWAEVQETQRGEITAAVAAAAEADDLDQLDALTVDTGRGAELLAARMLAYAQRAGEAMQREAEAQGVTVPDWSLDDEALTAAAFRDRLRQVARATARVLGVGLVQSAVRRAMQLWGSGTAQQVAQQVDEHLAGLSDATVREQLGAAMSAAQNEGRMAVLQAAPAASRYVATEILDGNTCKPCRNVDGTEYATLTAVRAAYPSGGYTGCLGGPRCRGTFVAVWGADGEEDAAAATLAAYERSATATVAEVRAAQGVGEGEDTFRTGPAPETATITKHTDRQEGAVPYSIVEGHPDCAADTPYAVVKGEGESGELMGCHATKTDAEEQQAALYAAEGGDQDDDENKDEGEDMAGKTAPWEGVLAVEGIVTGDGREFAPDSLTWGELPLPLRWNKEDSHGGEPRTIAVNVGRIDRIWRDGNKVMGAGVLDLSDEDGRRVHAKLKGGFLRGVSIDADSIGDADIEFIWPEDDVEGEGEESEDLFELLFAQPEKILFKAGRIRAATLVDIPAFAEAYIALLDEEGAIVAGGTPVGEDLARQAAMVGGAITTHSTATSEGEWDAAANEKRLEGPLTLEIARAMYAWYDEAAIEDGELPKSACKFPHHEVGEDGRPGAANLAACSAVIAALHGGRGGSDIPDADRRGVYDHVAKHLRDAGQEPEPFRSRASLAASGPWRPPAAWFADPKLSVPTPITITDSGRIYGHAAQWGTCHVGYADTCVQPPREDAHPYYMTGEVVCDDGTPVAVGQITVGTGHAPLHLGAGPAAEHYDNTGHAVADVAVGNDRHGIWVAGAIRPGADPDLVHQLRAAGQVSGDWRRIGGQLRLVGLLAVNVPGFPVPKMRARVASGQPLALVAAGRPTVAPPVLSQEEKERQAVRTVMEMLRNRVHARR